MSKSTNQELLSMMFNSKEVFEFVRKYLMENDVEYSENAFFNELIQTLNLSCVWEEIHEELRNTLIHNITAGFKEKDLDRIDRSEDYLLDMLCDDVSIDEIMMQSIFTPAPGHNSEEVCKAFDDAEKINSSWEDISVYDISRDDSGLVSPLYELYVNCGTKKKGTQNKPVVLSLSSPSYLSLVNEMLREGIDGGMPSKKRSQVVSQFVTLLLEDTSSKFQGVVSKYRSEIEEELKKIESSLKSVKVKKAALRPDILRFQALEKERKALISKMEKELEDVDGDFSVGDLLNDL